MSIKISVILFILSGFKVSDPTWSDKFELTKGSYSVSDIKGYCEYISKSLKRFHQASSYLIHHQVACQK